MKVPFLREPGRPLLNSSACWYLATMPTPRDSSARILNRERFEAAMRSEPVQRLIRENASTDRISALVGASPNTIRAWLKAHAAWESH